MATLSKSFHYSLVDLENVKFITDEHEHSETITEEKKETATGAAPANDETLPGGLKRCIMEKEICSSSTSKSWDFFSCEGCKYVLLARERDSASECASKGSAVIFTSIGLPKYLGSFDTDPRVAPLLKLL